MHKAYLLIRLKLDNSPMPKVAGVSIYSDRNPSCRLTSEAYAEILSVEGESYQHCVDKITEIVNTVEYFKWMRVWLDGSREAHTVRGYLTGVL